MQCRIGGKLYRRAGRKEGRIHAPIFLGPRIGSFLQVICRDLRITIRWNGCQKCLSEASAPGLL